MICLIGQLNLKYLLTFKLVISHAKNVSAEGECHFYLSWLPPLPTCILKCVLQLRRSRAVSTDLVQEFGCNDQKLCFFFFLPFEPCTIIASSQRVCILSQNEEKLAQEAVQYRHIISHHVTLAQRTLWGVKHSRPNCLLKHIHKCVTVSKKNKLKKLKIKQTNMLLVVSSRKIVFPPFPGETSQALKF